MILLLLSRSSRVSADPLVRRRTLHCTLAREADPRDPRESDLKAGYTSILPFFFWGGEGVERRGNSAEFKVSTLGGRNNVQAYEVKIEK